LKLQEYNSSGPNDNETGILPSTTDQKMISFYLIISPSIAYVWTKRSRYDFWGCSFWLNFYWALLIILLGWLIRKCTRLFLMTFWSLWINIHRNAWAIQATSFPLLFLDLVGGFRIFNFCWAVSSSWVIPSHNVHHKKPAETSSKVSR